MSTESLQPFSSFLKFLRYTHALFSAVITVFIIFLATNSYVLTLSRVDGLSMEPTLMNRQLILVNLIAYRIETPKRGDVVIIQHDSRANIRIVKRIYGIPGDTVKIARADILLKEGEYYILGDNQDHSTDSRVFGLVRKEQIIGKVVISSNK